MAGLIALGGCGGGGDQRTDGGSSADTQSSTTSLPAVRRQTRHAQKQLEKQHRSESPSGGETPSSSGGESTTPLPAPPASHHDSGGGAAQFRVKEGDNTVQEFGQEAGAAERTRAAAALHGYLDARAARDWSSACSFLSLSTLAAVEQIPKIAQKEIKGKISSCPAVLEALTAGAPTAALKASAIADVGALRVRGSSAYLLFYGFHHHDLLMPMVKERGSWKVGGVEPVPVV
jgi:hypothetical protein